MHIQAFTLTLSDHGRLTGEHISKHSHENLQTCWTPWSTRETRGLWARPPVLTPVPVQAFDSRACLNLQHCDIQSTAQKSPRVNNFFEAIEKKKTNKQILVTVWEPGQDTQNKDTRSRNSNRTTLRSSPHARRPSIVDTSKTKAQIWAKGTTERACLLFFFKKKKTSCARFAGTHGSVLNRHTETF